MKVSELSDHIKQADEISFIIGAGASKSAGIPLANDLIKMIEETYGHCLKGLSGEERKNYGRVMAALSPRERKTLIEPLLSNAKLNWGHVALASTIQQSSVKRILSFNFDFLLEQAVGLLGEHLPVYDFGIAPASDVTGLADKAIFHLHGQSYGLKLLNSEDETAKHAESLRPLLNDSLRNHVTIVTGYSGSADGAFKIMLDAYNGDNRLFWLGYDKEPNSDIAPLFEKSPYAEYIGGCDFDLSMIEIARGLSCWPLPILDNPPRHVLQQLAPLPAFPTGEETETAVLHETKMRLDRLGDTWDADRSNEERESAALMAGLEIDENADLSGYSEEAKDMRAWRFIHFGNQFADEAKALEGKEQSGKYRAAGKQYAKALCVNPNMHEAFFNWGNALSDEAMTLDGEAKAKKLNEACQKYAEAIRIKPKKYEAFNNWGNALYYEAMTLNGEAKTKKLNEAYAKFAEAIRIKPNYHKAFYNWGNALGDEAMTVGGKAKEKGLKEACQKYAEAIRIKPDDNEVFNNWGNALYYEAMTLDGEAKTKKLKEACQKYAEAIRIKPDNHETFDNWATALLIETHLLEGAERNEKLVEALEKAEQAKRLGKIANYNLACVHAVMGNLELALDELEACAKDGTLPDKDHLAEDSDMDSLREHPRFLALVEG